ncbi:MAG: dihydrodipicolinate synthase family protein, partial [Clostridia bacterium]|nr:dihydrodipicolinate synthase family protein [Clostridia bacterium]
AVAAGGTDALILITNRLDPKNEGDDVFLKNAERLIERLPPDLPLGLYECPWPYKRLVTPRILSWCVQTGRFRYMKDTCCDARLIGERVGLLAGSGFRLLNANCQTLLETMRMGADGYCGIMANFHPRLYVWLRDHWLSDPERASDVGAAIGTLGFTEGGLPYPLTAKYHMTLSGIPTENLARNRRPEEMTAYARAAVENMKRMTDRMEKDLGLR